MLSDEQKRIKHPLAHQFYNYILGRRFSPGAQAESFEPRYQNPIFSFRGAGRLAGSLMATEHPQVYVARPAVPIAGIPTTAGQYILQPLLDEGESGS